MNCRIINESDIGEAFADTLKKCLCICYPKDVEVFSKVTYWYSIPSYRVVVERDNNIISHIAIIDRIIGIGQKQVRVAGIQSVFVLPEYRGQNLCDKMFSMVLDESRRRNHDFSVLFCKPVLEKFYNRFGYEMLDNMQLVFLDDSGMKQILSGEEIAMWTPVCKDVFPLGNICLNGNKW